MKTMRKTLAVLLALTMALALGGTAAAEREARRMETAADADEWAAVFLGEHPEELEGVWLMTLQMQAAVAQLGGMKGMADSLVMLGEVVRIEAARAEKVQGYDAFFIPCVFTAMPLDLILTVQDGAIAGLGTGAYTGGREKEETGPASFRSVELALPVPALNGELPGTLTLPEGDGPFPAVVLVHGSGPNDRDETVMGLKPFRDLAEGLAAQGVAVYRFDKRTYVYGAAMAADRQATLMDESVEDAAAAVQLLASQEGIDPERIFVLGHSLGGNAVPAIARVLRDRPTDARGFILMAASPRPLEVLMREQAAFLLSLMPEIPAEVQAETDALLADLDKLQDLDALTDGDTVAGAYAPYWKWLAAYDILAAAEEITQPCLLLQGEEDYQVTMTDFGLWRDALGDQENWRFISYPGLTHCFTPGQKTEGSAAYARTEKVDAQVILDIAAFVLGNGTR
ncbi:MAG: alpha/beta fold hydrolase [Clostridia bacterium]|nr:alpha/beta fold hydrolase [Clostridia bacterium]